MAPAMLQQLADAAFEAILQNTGLTFAHSTIEEAVSSFDSITSTKGVAWLIDATTGTGMTHLTWTYWMVEAKAHLGDKGTAPCQS